jgi:hypothetical protein
MLPESTPFENDGLGTFYRRAEPLVLLMTPRKRGVASFAVPVSPSRYFFQSAPIKKPSTAAPASVAMGCSLSDLSSPRRLAQVMSDVIAAGQAVEARRDHALRSGVENMLQIGGNSLRRHPVS